MNVSPAALTCPKCGAEMRPYERNGVVIDQCTGCRGIFLDRGEMESLIDAESYFNAARNPAPGIPQAPYPQAQYPDRRDSHHGGHDGRGSGHGDRDDRRKRGGFLGDLFG
ncbi:zf-TFIIB domain-containing protein [Neomicrococcus lactis]|uniref:TFIIB-type zinc ribbon-containing protein n=1 Tax=Neomicrococcus lactis TaxID=732241 RepID=UPI00230178A9|nr:zf-TFIIB domain-containing protein [Neomicrococcus lactis]